MAQIYDQTFKAFSFALGVASVALLSGAVRPTTSAGLIAVGMCCIWPVARSVKSLLAVRQKPPQSVADTDTNLDVNLAGPDLNPLPDDLNCRKLGRAVGSMIRREMGYPKLSEANRVVAAQRIESYRKANLPTLRVIHGEVFAEHALYWVFTPTELEKRTCARLYTAADARVRAIPQGRYDYDDSMIMRALPPAASNSEFVQWLGRTMGFAPFVGPDFQPGSALKRR